MLHVVLFLYDTLFSYCIGLLFGRSQEEQEPRAGAVARLLRAQEVHIGFSGRYVLTDEGTKDASGP